jgi:hydroxyethylthiazole kinase
MGIAGEMAYKAAGGKGTASFRTAIIDSISVLNQKIMEEMANVNAN